MTINPDLLFDRGIAVGDVKYKLLNAEWQRPDLYQITAFATGFRSSYGALFGFKVGAGITPPIVSIGEQEHRCIQWDCSLSAEQASEALAEATRSWIENIRGNEFVGENAL